MGSSQRDHVLGGACMLNNMIEYKRFTLTKSPLALTSPVGGVQGGELQAEMLLPDRDQRKVM